MPGWKAARRVLAQNRESSAHSWNGCGESADLGDFWSPGNCARSLCFRLRPSRILTVLPIVFFLFSLNVRSSSCAAPKSSQSISLAIFLSSKRACPHPSPEPQNFTFLPCRMLQLSLSWLGMGPLTASPWHLLLLGGASWILARILAWIYAFYDNCSRLRCFPQPPKPSWFWGHLAMVSVAVGRSLGRCVPNVFGKVIVKLGSGEAWNTGQ